MPGPQPSPTRLKILKGAKPYRINQDEPKPQSHSGKMPPGWAPHMSRSARTFWKKYAPVLSRIGVLTESDLPALRILAELWSKWTTAQRAINKKGLTYESKNDEGEVMRIYQRPEVKLADQLETQMLRYLQHFGMTASSRGKISIAGLSSEEEDEDLD